jgi:hypothetical protein
VTSFDQLHKKAQEAISSSMGQDESIALTIPGENGSAMVATNRRVFVFKKGATARSMFGKQLNSWDYSSVSVLRSRKE